MNTIIKGAVNILQVCAGEKNDYINLNFINSQPVFQIGKKYLFTHKSWKYIDYIVVESLGDNKIKRIFGKRVNFNLN